MQLNVYFIILTFIVVLITIMLSKDLFTGIMIVTLLANFIMISINLSRTVKVDTDKPSADQEIDDIIDAASKAARTQDGAAVDENDTPHIYGPEYDIYHKDIETYNTAYDDPKFPLNRGITEAFQGVDAANAYMAQSRARDKKCLDGLTAKTSDFYKHHYSNEFALEEAKRWWGNYEV
jgi:hypothetical protein